MRVNIYVCVNMLYNSIHKYKYIYIHTCTECLYDVQLYFMQEVSQTGYDDADDDDDDDDDDKNDAYGDLNEG